MEVTRKKKRLYIVHNEIYLSLECFRHYYRHLRIFYIIERQKKIT